MDGKLLEIVVCVLSIGVLQYFTVLGCQTTSDCRTQTTTGSTKLCCYNVYPPRCMGWGMCSWYQNDHTKQAPTFYPKFTVPDYPTFTVPDYNGFTVPDYNELTVPNIDVPTYNYNNNDDYGHYGSDTDNSSSEFSPGALIGGLVSFIMLTFMIFCLRWVRYRQPRHVLLSSAASTGQTNVVAPQNREARRIVIIAVTRNEDQINRQQNQPPDGEPPFLSEEDILHNLHNNCAQDPPPYDEATAGSHLPKYEELVNENMDLPPPPAYPEVQTTSQSSANPYLNTLPTQHNVVIEPPSYDEAQTASNEAVHPIPY